MFNEQTHVSHVPTLGRGGLFTDKLMASSDPLDKALLGGERPKYGWVTDEPAVVDPKDMSNNVCRSALPGSTGGGTDCQKWQSRMSVEPQLLPNSQRLKRQSVV